MWRVYLGWKKYYDYVYIAVPGRFSQFLCCQCGRDCHFIILDYIVTPHSVQYEPPGAAPSSHKTGGCWRDCCISSQHLSNDLLYAYKLFHSIETALLKIHNDIVCNMDNGKLTALILLDLSAAFGTIDHDILLQRLHR